MTDRARSDPKSARRSGSDKRRLTATLPRVRCTEAQRTHIEAAADRSGFTLSAYIMAAALSAASGGGIAPIRAAKVAKIDREILTRTLAQLGRLNGNLYQIVRALNFRDTPDLSALSAYRLEVAAVCSAVMQALGKRTDETPDGGGGG